MAEGRGSIRSVAWEEIFPWLILFRTVRIAMSGRVLALAAFALLAVTAGWKLIGDVVYSNSSDPQIRAWKESQVLWPWETGGRLPHEVSASTERHGLGWRLTADSVERGWRSGGPLVAVWRDLTQPFLNLFLPNVSVAGFLYSLLCGGWAVAVWALYGGAITRIAALNLSRHESLGVKSAFKQSIAHWPSYSLAPFFPLAGTLLGFMPLIFLGFLLRSDVLLFAAGFVWPLVLLGGLFVSILLLGLLLAWPLMWPTISVEGTDAFDALSRSYAYVFQRPLHYLFYALVASILGVAGSIVVDLFAAGVLEFSAWGLSWGTGSERWTFLQDALRGRAIGPSSWTARIGTFLIILWNGIVPALQMSFRFAFFWSASTAIYLLLRRDVDATDLDEVALEDQPETYGLPPLTSDASGVPLANGDPSDA